METFETEEQQVEALKKFWQENGNSIIAGVVIGFGGFIGFNFYKDNKLEAEYEASQTYQTILDANNKDQAVFNDSAEQFIAANPNSSYATLTAFALAKSAAEKQDWSAAATHLTEAVKQASTAELKAVAIVRLARVQIQQTEYEQALATIDAELPASFKAAAEEIKGDVYLKQSKKELARNAYQAAIDANGLATNPSLQYKIDDLAQATNLTK